MGLFSYRIKTMSNLKSCPFCGFKKIKLSIATSTHLSQRWYKVAYYCTVCNAYGPRALYKPDTPNVNRTELERNLQVEDNPIRQEAEKVWNTRG